MADILNQLAQAFGAKSKNDLDPVESYNPSAPLQADIDALQADVDEREMLGFKPDPLKRLRDAAAKVDLDPVRFIDEDAGRVEQVEVLASESMPEQTFLGQSDLNALLEKIDISLTALDDLEGRLNAANGRAKEFIAKTEGIMNRNNDELAKLRVARAKHGEQRESILKLAAVFRHTNA